MIQRKLPAPVAQTAETVTFRRTDWNAILEHLENMEDIAALDLAAVTSRRNLLSNQEVDRLLRGEHPIKIWREKRSLSQRDLAAGAEVSPSYLAEIEMHRKRGSLEAIYKISQALRVPMEYLLLNRVEQIVSYIDGLVRSDVTQSEVNQALEAVCCNLAKVADEEGWRDQLRSIQRDISASFDRLEDDYSKAGQGHWRHLLENARSVCLPSGLLSRAGSHPHPVTHS